jgi:RNA polymerase sigma factor (sigma-70 family)
MRKEKDAQEMTPDWLLLRRYTKDNSQEAFAALSARYLNMVYAVCLREVHDPELAQDVTQAVFLLLARTAPSFRSKTALPGWLFRTARFASQNARTREQRRRHYEEKAAMEERAAMERDPPGEEDAAWKELEPLLNRSLAALREEDRSCVLLRFFQGASFAEIGAAFGVSEDGARKRVIRSLSKMHRYFTKNGIIVPSAALATLLTAHAAKAAPAACQASITHLMLGVLAGHTTAVLTGSHVYQLSEGAMKAMKIAQIKVVVGVTTAVMVVGAGTYGVVWSAASTTKLPPPSIVVSSGAPPARTTANNALIAKLTADSTPSQYRTVTLTGKVRRADGAPVGRVHVCAKIQDSEIIKLFKGKSGMSTPSEMEISASFAHTKPDGTYTLYVGDGVKYNVFIAREDIMKVSEPDTGMVAAVAEGISGSKGSTVSVPDLVLTPGGIVTGTVTDKATGRPIAGAAVLGNGALSPQSTTGVLGTQTDSTGTYRLRVAPGKNLVYEGNSMAGTESPDNSRTLEVAEGQTATVNFQVTAK